MTFDSRGGFLSTDDVAHLLTTPDSLCWWCRNRQAATGEHKFKRSVLARLMGDGSDQVLMWGDGETLRELRGKSGITRDRYNVVKFPKSMCAPCNNGRSQPFDFAYDVYAEHLHSYALLRKMPVMDFTQIYGTNWQDGVVELARYHAKHFGCRMVRNGLPVPDSLRDFLNGAAEMPDAQMHVISTDTVHEKYKKGLSISPDFAAPNESGSAFSYYVMAAYIGSLGIRYEWRADGEFSEESSSFFHYPQPVITHFRTEEDMAMRRPRKSGWFARLALWAASEG
ncbi:hypothetical protein ACFW61_36130 [Streptomyces microflavus]|uniref:hypothetical protein n=1 Tax=Streptomyces microflavus TaxID=1919 RepID=UPI0036C812B5